MAKERYKISLSRKPMKSGTGNFYMSSPLNMQAVLEGGAPVISNMTIDDLSDETAVLECGPRYEKGKDIALTFYQDKENKMATSAGMWHKSGVSPKTGKEYSFYSIGNINAMQIMQQIGNEVTLFVFPNDKAGNDKRPDYKLVFKSTMASSKVVPEQTSAQEASAAVDPTDLGDV